LTGSGAGRETDLRRRWGANAARLRIARLANPARVLDRARLTVCHGGSGTVYQSLAAGVPVVCLPGNPDQAIVSRAAVAHGAGTALPAETASAGRVLRACDAVLNGGRGRSEARTLARVLRLHDTRGRWLRFLQDVAEGAPASDLVAHDPNVAVSGGVG
jgi:UDP:flavonoid glycosyltransferase YjiC (YdhE family)